MGYFTFRDSSYSSEQRDEEKPAYIIIEASSLEVAVKIMRGRFDYYVSENFLGGDYTLFEVNSNTDLPKIFGKTIKEYIESLDWPDEAEKEIILINWKDKALEKIEINIKEQIEKNAARKRKKADKLWGAVVNPFGVNKKPIRFYYDEKMGEYWDKEEAVCIKAAGYIKSKDNQVATYASKNKEEVQLFIDGMESSYLQLLYYTEDMEPRNEQEEFAVDFINSYLQTLV